MGTLYKETHHMMSVLSSSALRISLAVFLEDATRLRSISSHYANRKSRSSVSQHHLMINRRSSASYVIEVCRNIFENLLIFLSRITLPQHLSWMLANRDRQELLRMHIVCFKLSATCLSSPLVC